MVALEKNLGISNVRSRHILWGMSVPNLIELHPIVVEKWQSGPKWFIAIPRAMLPARLKENIDVWRLPCQSHMLC